MLVAMRHFLVVLEKKDALWVVKQEPVKAGIGKNGFAPRKTRRRWQITDRNISLGKLFSYKATTLMENQQP
jgi:hypothetical protein